jgi:small subunit ribosomal protein S6
MSEDQNKRHYESVFIITPLLTDEQMKEVVEKFRKVLKDNGAEIVHDENWGLKKLAYPIKKKSTGFYQLFEFKASPDFVAQWETEFKRDERIMRYLTVQLDKYGIAFNEKRRKGEVGKRQSSNAEEQEPANN